MPLLPSIEHRIAAELSVAPAQVEAAVRLLDEGATVPFVARYRKEATGGLDDTQLRTLEERLGYLRELEDRRATVLASIAEQGKLTDALRADVEGAQTKQRLEDLYAPYKPKRRTKAQIAREAGLEPLADALLADPSRVPEEEAAKFLRAAFTTPDGDNPGVPDAKAALEGARHILVERFAEDAQLVGRLRELLLAQGRIVATRDADAKVKDEDAQKFSDYFAHDEPIATIPSHRALALLRGRREQVLRVSLKLPEELTDPPGRALTCERAIAARFGIEERGRAADAWLAQTVRWAWSVKLAWQLETELVTQMRERAEDEAIHVFARNLHDLLLAAPAGARATMGLDPGLRTGVKVAVVDGTGKLVATDTVWPHVPRNDWDGAIASLAKLARAHSVQLVAIGNGTASRETDRLVGDLVRRHPELALTKAVVSEAGASVYSASELAAREFPELDVSLRGAVSIARRLQDPLAELVKIDPKSIGVGQYQHDVSQTRLARTLDAVVEDAVNAVGVDVNTASVALLARISGLSRALAENIVRHRDAKGRFEDRRALLEVPRLGEKAFEQAAGFLRVIGGTQPLDASAVHPEAYPVVERILADVRRGVRDVIGRPETLRGLRAERYCDERFGLPTVRDILSELEKPGRDPRPEFKTAAFREGVEDLKDLRPDMVLEGVVTNVTAFGAFVDVGVHQDGLVHISALSRKFVRDAREVVKAGDLVKVKVLDVDLARRRVALTMRLDDPAGPRRPADGPRGGGRPDPRGAAPGRAEGRAGARPAPREPAAAGAMADALAKALGRR
ncbi:MAG: Tex family protein [Burkholderiaceae bacterium]